jgi:sarcosine oxidase
MNSHFDHIVVGVGAMGSSTCYYLAKSGASVLGLEQFGIVHEHGAHGGQSRIIRKAYFEHPDYIPLLKRAYENWEEIESVSGKKFYHKTGLFYTGPSGHEIIENVRSAATQYNIPLLDATKGDSLEIVKHFSLPKSYEWLFEPEAGYLKPELAIQSYVDQAKQLGAEIHEHEKVLKWEVNGDLVVVKTEKGNYTCKKLVVTAGPWSAKLMPFIQDQLTITRQTMMWVQPNNEQAFQEHHFPCWFVVDEAMPGAYYGFPIMDGEDARNPIGFKLAYHYPGNHTDPDCVDINITHSDTGPLLEFIDKYIPDAKGQVLGIKTCLYSNSQDEHFVMDNLAGMEDKVCYARGFSGHGFKFVSVVGEIMADLAIKGTTSHPIAFLSAKRFEKH